jgi:hypothetical protein
MDGLNSTSKDANIGFEDTQEVIQEGLKLIKAVPKEGIQLQPRADEAKEVLNRPDEQNQNLVQAINQLEEIEVNENEELHQAMVGIVENLHEEVPPTIVESEEVEIVPENVEDPPIEQTEYRTRYG